MIAGNSSGAVDDLDVTSLTPTDGGEGGACSSSGTADRDGDVNDDDEDDSFTFRSSACATESRVENGDRDYDGGSTIVPPSQMENYVSHIPVAAPDNAPGSGDRSSGSSGSRQRCSGVFPSAESDGGRFDDSVSQMARETSKRKIRWSRIMLGRQFSGVCDVETIRSRRPGYRMNFS